MCKLFFKNYYFLKNVRLKRMNNIVSEIPISSACVSCENALWKNSLQQNQLFWRVKRVEAAETSPLCFLSNCGLYPQPDSSSGPVKTPKNRFPMEKYLIFGRRRHFQELVSAEIPGRFWPKLSLSRSIRSKLVSRLIWALSLSSLYFFRIFSQKRGCFLQKMEKKSSSQGKNFPTKPLYEQREEMMLKNLKSILHFFFFHLAIFLGFPAQKPGIFQRFFVECIFFSM